MVATPEKLGPDEQQATNTTVAIGEETSTASTNQCSESKLVAESSEMSCSPEEKLEEPSEMSEEKQNEETLGAEEGVPEVVAQSSETLIVVEAEGQANATSIDPAEVNNAQEEETKEVTCNVESAAPSDLLQSSSHEVKCDSGVQSSDTVVESGQTPIQELDIMDALDCGISSDETTKDVFTARPIEVTEALDVETPNEASPETQTVETEPNRISDDKDTNVVAVCSFCEQVIDGNIRIILNEPAISCHPECLKCAVCACVLGNLTSPMFLRKQQIQCEICSANPITT
ncbi:zinc finger protein 185-like [Synchiropus splendidus]|uniref:zinc finger protein 185-like n=1 Tax=Synchiropus splendidus TaxID=270530 RepID=UPI00237E8D0F|nr:zinc finger protein 185-like [Synchiropus splendidus]